MKWTEVQNNSLAHYISLYIMVLTLIIKESESVLLNHAQDRWQYE